MDKTARAKKASKKTAAPAQFNKNVGAEMPTAASLPQSTIGHFSVPDVCAGVVKVANEPERVRIAFEFDFAEPEALDPAELTVDLVLGPLHWHEGAEVFEVKGVPLTGNTAAFDLAPSDTRRVAGDGKAQFYGRVHSPNGTHFLNRDGRPYENFEL